MNQHLTLVTLGVADVPAARAFYVDGLGWDVVFENVGDVVFVQLGHGLLLALFGAADLAADAGLAPLVIGSGSVSLAKNVESAGEVDTVMATAVAAGGAVVKPAQPAVWGGYHGYFSDPDGVLWEVAHNPGLVADDDGRVTMAAVEP